MFYLSIYILSAIYAMITFNFSANIYGLLCVRHCAILVCGWVVIKMWSLFPRNSWLVEGTNMQTTNHQYTLCWVLYGDMKKVLREHRGRVERVFKEAVTVELVIKGGIRILQVEKRDRTLGRRNSSSQGKMMWKSMTDSSVACMRTGVVTDDQAS